MSAIEQHHKYLCQINLRPTFCGRPLKPSCLALNGKTILLQADWCMDDEDGCYPGEWAMSPVDGSVLSRGVAWIASGDVRNRHNNQPNNEI